LWLTGHLEWSLRRANHDQGELALAAQQLDFLVQDKEMTEAAFHDALRAEYERASKPGPSRVP
jgi:hypothetical protein